MSRLCFACKSNFSDYPCDLCLSKVCKGCSFFCEVCGIHEGKLICRSCNAFLNFQKNFYTYRHVEIQKIKLEVQREEISEKNPETKVESSASSDSIISNQSRSESNDPKGDYRIEKTTSLCEKSKTASEQSPESSKPPNSKSPTSTTSILSSTPTTILSTSTTTTILPTTSSPITSTSSKEASSPSWTSIPLCLESTICPGSVIWKE